MMSAPTSPNALYQRRGTHGNPIDETLSPLPVFKRLGTPDNLDGFDLQRTVMKLLPIIETAKISSGAKCSFKPSEIRAVVYTLIVHESRRGRPLQENHILLLSASASLPTGKYPLKTAKIKNEICNIIARETRLGRPLQEDHLRQLKTAFDFRPLGPAARTFLDLASVRNDRLYAQLLRLAEIDAGKKLSTRAAARELEREFSFAAGDKTVGAWRRQGAYLRRRQAIESGM